MCVEKMLVEDRFVSHMTCFAVELEGMLFSPAVHNFTGSPKYVVNISPDLQSCRQRIHVIR